MNTSNISIVQHDEFKKILAEHQLWLDSKCERGVHARFARRSFSENIDFKGVRLSYSDLDSAVMRNCKLHGTDFTGANLNCIILKGSDLTSVNLTDCVLCMSDLSDVDLTNANLTNADLAHADLTGAQFTNELLRADSLQDCVMDWDKAPWVTGHKDFKTIEFV